MQMSQNVEFLPTDFKKNCQKMQQTLSNRIETGTNLSQAHDLYLAGCSVVYSFSSYFSIHRSEVTLPRRCSTVTLGLQGLTNSPVFIHIHGHITDHIVTGFAEKAVWVTPPSQQALMNDPMQVHAYEYWSGHATIRMTMFNITVHLWFKMMLLTFPDFQEAQIQGN